MKKKLLHHNFQGTGFSETQKTGIFIYAKDVLKLKSVTMYQSIPVSKTHDGNREKLKAARLNSGIIPFRKVRVHHVHIYN